MKKLWNKITGIEKVVIALILILSVFWVGSLVALGVALEEAGGAKEVIISVGKEIKDIKSQIQEGK